MVYELAPTRTALLIVDAQREYFDFDDTPAFIEGTTGVELIDELIDGGGGGGPVVDKTRYSAFVNTKLASILETSGAIRTAPHAQALQAIATSLAGGIADVADTATVIEQLRGR